MPQINDEYWTLAARILAGEATDDEQARFSQWLAEDDSQHRRWFEHVSQLWEASHETPDTPDVDAAWHRMERRLDVAARRSPSRGPSHRRRYRWVGPGVGIALALVVVLVVTLVVRQGPEALAPADAFAVETARGERVSVSLADGSRITLNVDSRIRAEGGFGSDHREIYLEGEAMLEVASDPALPFTVTTASGRIEVTGTRFAVRDYQENDFTVAVDEGAVIVRDVTSEVELRSGWRALVSDGRLVGERIEDPDAHFGWTQGRLVFRDERLFDVLPRLERWHDVDLKVASPALGDRRITTNFEGNTIDEVLDVVSIAIGADVSREGDAYVLRPDSQ